MAIVFLQKKQRQKYLLLSLLGAAVLVPVIWWRISYKPPEAGPLQPIAAPPKIEINYKVLENLELRELQPFEQISPFSGEAGRENPFASFVPVAE